MGPGYDGSHLKAMLEAGQVPQFINEVVPKLFERAAQEDQDAAKAADVGKAVLLPMWRHPTALYVGPVDMTNPRQPMPRVAILCDAGEEAADMRRQLEELIQQAGRDVPVPVAVRTSGNVVALVVGRTPELDAVLDGKSKTRALGGAKNFAAVASIQKSPVVAAYVDVEAILKFLDDAVAKGNDAEAKKNWPGGARRAGPARVEADLRSRRASTARTGARTRSSRPPRRGRACSRRSTPSRSATRCSARSRRPRRSPASPGSTSPACSTACAQAVAQARPQRRREMDEGIKQVNAHASGWTCATTCSPPSATSGPTTSPPRSPAAARSASSSSTG